MSEMKDLLNNLEKLAELFEAQLEHEKKSLKKAEMDVARMMAQRSLRRGRRGSNNT